MESFRIEKFSGKCETKDAKDCGSGQDALALVATTPSPPTASSEEESRSRIRVAVKVEMKLFGEARNGSVTDLSYDVLDQILTFLPAKSLAALSATSTLMKRLVHMKVARFLELNFVERTLRTLYPKSTFRNDLHFLSFVEDGFCTPTVSCGFRHAAIVTKLGNVYTWGSNAEGELGHGDLRHRRAPTRIDSITNAASVSCGKSHTNVLTKDGKVLCFGETKTVPTLIGGELSGKIIAKASSGMYMSAFLTTEGELFVSGHGIVLDTVRPENENEDEQMMVEEDDAGIPHNNATDVFTPRKVLLGELVEAPADSTNGGQSINPCRKFKIIQIAAGGRHLVILTNKGEVFTCGFGGLGQLGHGDTEDQLQPKKVASLMGKTIVYVSAGQYHTSAVSSTGELFSFGYNLNDYLGVKANGARSTGPQRQMDAADLEIVTAPLPVSLPSSAVMVASGNLQTLVLTSANEIVTFGKPSNSDAQAFSCPAQTLETRSATRNQPGESNPYQGLKQRLPRRGRYVQIAAGGELSCALTDQGDLVLANKGFIERTSLLPQARRTSLIDRDSLDQIKARVESASGFSSSSSSACSTPSPPPQITSNQKPSKKRLALTPISTLSSNIQSSSSSASGFSMNQSQSKRMKVSTHM